MWKRTVRDNMRLTREREWFVKTENSSTVQSIMRITEHNKEYVLWEISREFPKYYPFIQNAVCMLGLMYSGSWLRLCHLCQKATYTPTEHILLYCINTNDFRHTLWHRLIMRFGITFFSRFISESPNGQLEMLFSGCPKLLSEKKRMLLIASKYL